jgi:hypothetical protein
VRVAEWGFRPIVAGRSLLLWREPRLTAIDVTISIELAYVNLYAGGVAATEVNLHDPQTLYRRWEDEQRSPFQIALDNFITRYLEQSEQLPGFVEGYSKIHHDEQRHIAYGTWFLREAVRDEPALAEDVRAALRSLLPAVAQALTPPDREDTDWEALGASSEEIREFALSGLSRRLKVVGVPLETL